MELQKDDLHTREFRVSQLYKVVLRCHTGYLLTGDLLYQGVIYAHYPSTDPVSLYRSYCQLSQLETIRGILLWHHDSCLAPDILVEGVNLLESLIPESNCIMGQVNM